MEMEIFKQSSKWKLNCSLWRRWKIVSEEAIVPLKFYYKGDILKVGHSVDSMTLEEYRGKGIFKKLALLTLDEGKKRGYSFFYGFPNPNSKPIYLNKLNWKLIGNIRRWLFPLNLNFYQQGWK